MNFKQLREDFPTLRADPDLAYLDNACVTLKPDSVVNAIHDYYTTSPGCGGRSVHRYGTKVSQHTATARAKLATFINANSKTEMVFTRNATQSLNQVAHGMKWEKGDVVLTTDREHNSNLSHGFNSNGSKALTIGLLHRIQITHLTSKALRQHVLRQDRN